jgi:predicted HicB family RNase H-like nuclease
MSYKVPKYPRVLVSLKRHKVLAVEAEKLGISIAELVENKLAKAR